MRKSVLLVLSLLTVFLVTGCLLLQPPEAELKTITLDGNLSDWGTFLFTDGATDSKWGASNEVFKGGIILDATNLYIAGEFTKEGMNNLMVMIDIDGVKGAADTDKHPWGRKYKFEKGDVDVYLEAWDTGAEVWKFSTTGDATEITFEATSVVREGRIVSEIKIPLNKIGITDAKTASLRAVFAITGGSSEGKQWTGDFMPDQPHLTAENGGNTAPAVIKNVVENPKKK